jgi:hypothetical protein
VSNRKFTPARRRKPISARRTNEVHRAVEGLARARDGSASMQLTVADQPISITRRGTRIFKAKVQTGGVGGWDGTEMGVGDVMLQHRLLSGELTDGITVKAWSFVALAEDDYCYVAEVDGGYEVISAFCS